MISLKSSFKNFFAVFVMLFLTLSMSGVSAASKRALQKERDMLFLDGRTTVREMQFDDDITLTQTVSCCKYDYDEFCPESSYKYALVRVHLVYKDANGKILAAAYLESVFRYNPELKLAKCLSTSHKEYSSSPGYSITVFGRTKNEAISKGASFGKVTLSKNFSNIHSRHYVFSCDETGRLIKHVTD